MAFTKRNHFRALAQHRPFSLQQTERPDCQCTGMSSPCADDKPAVLRWGVDHSEKPQDYLHRRGQSFRNSFCGRPQPCRGTCWLETALHSTRTRFTGDKLLEEEEGFYILASQQGCVGVLGKVP